MKRQLWGLFILLVFSLLLTACQGKEAEKVDGAEEKDVEVHQEEEHDHEHDEGHSHDNEAPEGIKIEGLGDHYHTGDKIELTAVLDEESDHDHWHWYSRESASDEWETVSGQETEIFTGEATIDGLELKAVLFDDDHNPSVQSAPVKIVIDDHHGNDEESKKIYQGYFEDSQVKDRELSDWEGDWQSVYPYLLSGDLDEVFEHKAEVNGDKTAEEYKEYYETAYKTTVERIVIKGDTVTFYEDGKETTGTYENDGFEILDKGEGKKGVRFAFKLVDGPDELPNYILFSDHYIFPSKSYHYHLYAGDDRNKLLGKLDNWPTYYPAKLDADGLVRDMLAH